MTEQERNHLLRMVKHAERIKRDKERREKLLMVLTPEELAEAIKQAKRKYRNDFPP